MESRWDSRKRPLCVIHVAVKIVLGLRYKIRNRVMTHTRFLLLTRNTPLLKLCPRQQGERSQSVPLGTLSNSLRLNFLFYLNRLLISKIIIVHQNRCTWTISPLSPPFLSNPCTSSTTSKEPFLCFVCHTENPELSFACELQCTAVSCVKAQRVPVCYSHMY